VQGHAWPSWEEIVQQNWTGVSKVIREEIDEDYLFSRQLLSRTNTHLLPAEHLEYLDRVSNIEIDADTRAWVKEINTAILTGSDFKKLWRPQGKVTRFE
jgi:hypothetical protein